MEASSAASGNYRLRLSEAVGALSYALDLTEGQPPGHSLRATWIAMAVGHRLSFGQEALSALYYTTFLKDAGCSSNAARLWELYGGDEIAVKSSYKTVNSQSMVALAQFVLRHAGPGEGLRRRAGRFLALGRDGDALATELVATRCERGADIARRLGFSPAVAAGIRALDEHWNGGGRPEGLRGRAIPMAAQIALLAQVADVFHNIAGPAAARREIARRAGTWFDPTVAAVFADIAQEGWLWQGLAAEGLDTRVRALEPSDLVLTIDEEGLDRAAAAFADVIDAKSSFTSGHSRRVALYADAIAARFGWTGSQRRRLRRGALLHDIGKLGISNGILDKPGKPDDAEWQAIGRHPALSEEILGRVGVFRDIATMGGAHHERLDGKGYPRGITAESIDQDTRILTTADVFDALTAERPYRAAMPLADALSIMERGRGAAFDSVCLDLLASSAATLIDTSQTGST